MDFSGVGFKIGRAQRQAANLKLAIKGALDEDPYVIDSKRDPKNGHYVYTVHNLSPLSAEWSVLIGEILFNYRSALDYFAWQLVKLDGGEPNEWTQFPIRDDPFNEKGKLRRVDLAPKLKDPKLLDALDKAQPYHGIDGVPIIDQHPLRRLNLTNNWDKHRLLLLAVQALDQRRISWGGNLDDAQPVGWHFSSEPLKNGSEVARFDFGTQERPPHFNPNLELQVAIKEPLTPDGTRTQITPLSDLLKEIDWGVVEYVLADKFWHLLPTIARAQVFPNMRDAALQSSILPHG
jgi:hypothetical protein